MISRLANTLEKFAYVQEIALAASVLAILDDAIPIASAIMLEIGREDIATKIDKTRYIFPLVPAKKKFWLTVLGFLRSNEKKKFVKALKHQFRREWQRQSVKLRDSAEETRDRQQRARNVDPYNPIFMGSSDDEK